MYFHAVTQFSQNGEQLGTYDSLSEAERETGETKGSIRSQINGNRKYCFWHSHILRNDIRLRNGSIIKIEKLIHSKESIETMAFVLKELFQKN